MKRHEINSKYDRRIREKCRLKACCSADLYYLKARTHLALSKDTTRTACDSNAGTGCRGRVPRSGRAPSPLRAARGLKRHSLPMILIPLSLASNLGARQTPACAMLRSSDGRTRSPHQDRSRTRRLPDRKHQVPRSDLFLGTIEFLVSTTVTSGRPHKCRQSKRSMGILRGFQGYPQKSPQRKLSLRGKARKILKRLAPRPGLEPGTLRLTAECSTIELPRSMPTHMISA